MKLLTVVGARPQFIKAAVVSRAIAADPERRIHEDLVHTGQHYDEGMSEVFFVEMGIPRPAVNLQVGSGSHADTTGRMLVALESEIQNRAPDAVMVYGDTNSTLAGALAAAKLHVPIVHVEAGLRSFNRAMPEEVNRVLTDHLSRFLLCPTMTAIANLRTEGIREGVHHVGDVMYDAAMTFGEIAEERSTILEDLALSREGYFLATVHRAENTDDPRRLGAIFNAFGTIASRGRPVVLPVHPRTRVKLIEEGIGRPEGNALVAANPAVRLLDPISYLDMVQLEKNAELILTDSGGVQKEAYFHGKPCITMRDETEWVETVEAGWNLVVGADSDRIVEGVTRARRGSPIPDYGEGRAGLRILDLLCDEAMKVARVA